MATISARAQPVRSENTVSPPSLYTVAERGPGGRFGLCRRQVKRQVPTSGDTSITAIDTGRNIHAADGFRRCNRLVCDLASINKILACFLVLFMPLERPQSVAGAICLRPATLLAATALKPPYGAPCRFRVLFRVWIFGLCNHAIIPGLGVFARAGLCRAVHGLYAITACLESGAAFRLVSALCYPRRHGSRPEKERSRSWPERSAAR